MTRTCCCAVVVLLAVVGSARAEAPSWRCWCDPAIQNAGAAPLWRAACDGASDMAASAMYYEAVSLQSRCFYPAAADKFVRLLESCPSYRHRDDVVKRLYDIGNTWLNDTRKEMQQAREVREGKRLFVIPAVVTWNKKKPVFGEERRALELMEKVYRFDPKGPLADKALFLLGSVAFYRENWEGADKWFSHLAVEFPTSPLAPQAIELAIIGKSLSLEDAKDKEQLIAEIRAFVQTALKDYPEIGNDPRKREMLMQQLVNAQIAERKLKKGE
jgi:hypothetical protein